MSLVMMGSPKSYKKLVKTGMVTKHWPHAATDSLTKDALFGTFSTEKVAKWGNE